MIQIEKAAILLMLILVMASPVIAQSDDNFGNHNYVLFSILSTSNNDFVPTVYVMDMNTSHIIQLAKGFLTSSWSPSGQRIAFPARYFGEQHRESIFILDMAKDQLTAIERGMFPPQCERMIPFPVWLTDESAIVHCQSRDDAHHALFTISSNDYAEITQLDIDLSKLSGHRVHELTILPEEQQLVILHSFSYYDSNEKLNFINSGISLLNLETGQFETIYSIGRYHGFDDLFYISETQELLIGNGWWNWIWLNKNGEVLAEHALSDEQALLINSAEAPTRDLSPTDYKLLFNMDGDSLATFNLQSDEVEVIFSGEPGDLLMISGWSPLLDEPLDLPDEPYTLEYLCGLLEESGDYCSEDLFAEKDSNSD